MSTFTDVREQLGSRLQNYNLEVFKEPRGIMRILHLVFALITILVLRSYEGFVDIECGCCPKNEHIRFPIKYPFNLLDTSTIVSCSNGTMIQVSLMNDFSSEAEVLFTTCCVSVFYVVFISFVYVKFREDYESNGNLALYDFVVSVLLAVLWIASFGAWGYGQSELKRFTQPDYLKTNLYSCLPSSSFYIQCLTIERSSVSGITETLILSFLNFFLWATGLWFLYKETPWYLQFQRA